MKFFLVIIKITLVLFFLPFGVVGLIMTLSSFDSISLFITIMGLAISLPAARSIFKDYKNHLNSQKEILNNVCVVNTAHNTVTPIAHKPAEPSFEALPNTLKGMPRAYKYDDVDVAIIRENKPDFNLLNPNMLISFVPEPTNPYDPNAVIVKAGDINIGYLYRGNLQKMMLDFLKRGDPVKGIIASIDEKNSKVKITIGFYKEQESDYDRLIRTEVPYKTFKLSGNSKEDIQDCISTCYEGDEVEYEFDFDKDKYEAICGDTIGYFPKSAEKYLEGTHLAFISEIEEDDNDKYIVKVAVFYET